ncbi:hypothetical protein PMIN04_002862 [Paraphaeosphaeria minitans]
MLRFHEFVLWTQGGSSSRGSLMSCSVPISRDASIGPMRGRGLFAAVIGCPAGSKAREKSWQKPRLNRRPSLLAFVESSAAETLRLHVHGSLPSFACLAGHAMNTPPRSSQTEPFRTEPRATWGHGAKYATCAGTTDGPEDTRRLVAAHTVHCQLRMHPLLSALQAPIDPST